MSRPITVTVGPLATAAATGAALSQKAARTGTNYLVLNGASGSFTANGVCASQTPGAAGPLTLNGSLASSAPTGTAVAYLGSPRRIYITGGSDESGKTFAVVGYGFSPSGGPFAITETITGPNASTVSSLNTYSQIISITASAATTGAITVGAYGTVTLDTARQVILTSAGNDSGITFTLTGTDVNNQPISETLTGGNATLAASTLSYKTLTSIASSGAVATTVTAGTNGVAHSPWVRFDDYASNAQVAIQNTVTGTVNYTVQQTMQDPNSISDPVAASAVVWVNHPDTALVAATTTLQGRYDAAPVFSRVVLNSGTGSVSSVFRQLYLG